MITDFPLNFASFRKIARPNQFLALPTGFTAVEQADLNVASFAASMDQVRDAWLEILRSEARISGIRQLDGQIEAIQRTSLVGFPDWITAQPVDLGNGRASICIFSRSKYGIRDFGVNEKRVRAWLALLSANLV
jgi:uncharacterized protein (DUF1499 family)